MPIKNRMLFIAAFLLLRLGALGLLPPLLPSAPFILAEAGCFSTFLAMQAGKQRIRFSLELCENSRNRACLPVGTTTYSLLWLWRMLPLSILLTRWPWIFLLPAAVGAAVAAHQCTAWPKETGDRGKRSVGRQEAVYGAVDLLAALDMGSAPLSRPPSISQPVGTLVLVLHRWKRRGLPGCGLPFCAALPAACRTYSLRPGTEDAATKAMCTCGCRESVFLFDEAPKERREDKRNDPG